VNTTQPKASWRRRRVFGAGVFSAVVVGGTIAGLVVLPSQAGAQHVGAAVTKPRTLEARKIKRYGEVLTNSKGRSLYVLSTESKGKLHCVSKECLSFWPPLLVAEHAKITVGAGVKGKVSHIVRGSKWQVTYNGWPVYTFADDTGPGQSNGEGIKLNGGLWTLVHASAKTNAGTPVKPDAGNGGTTTTTTTSPYGGSSSTTTTTAPW
jgi:predicted lipoprotein with Yx(FWY)xxD motif